MRLFAVASDTTAQCPSRLHKLLYAQQLGFEQFIKIWVLLSGNLLWLQDNFQISMS